MCNRIKFLCIQPKNVVVFIQYEGHKTKAFPGSFLEKLPFPRGIYNCNGNPWGYNTSEFTRSLTGGVKI